MHANLKGQQEFRMQDASPIPMHDLQAYKPGTSPNLCMLQLPQAQPGAVLSV